MGVYRLGRDSCFAVGAIIAGLLAIAAIGGLTFLSGGIVAVVMYETLPGRRKMAPLNQ